MLRFSRYSVVLLMTGFFCGVVFAPVSGLNQSEFDGSIITSPSIWSQTQSAGLLIVPQKMSDSLDG